MSIYNFLDLQPVVYSFLANLICTFFTQIINFSVKRRTPVAEVFKKYVHDKVIGNNLALILANIFGTELHLARHYIIAPLYEGCIEHDPTHGLI